MKYIKINVLSHTILIIFCTFLIFHSFPLRAEVSTQNQKVFDLWQIINFFYDYVGQVPHLWDDQKVSKAVNKKNKIQLQATKMTGEEIYQFQCAVCHGKKGAGDGPAADFLYPRPRDFTLGLFKYKTSPGELPPRDEDLFNAIKQGLNGTAMPSWKSIFNDEQINSLIPIIKDFDISYTWVEVPEDDDDYSEEEDDDTDTNYEDDDDDDTDYEDDDESEKNETNKPKIFIHITEIEPTNGQIVYSNDSIAKGKIVFENNCKQCHGLTGRGNITSGKRLTDDWGYRIWPRNLTQPWTWRATNVPESQEQTIRNIYLRISIGIFGTPMPAHRSTTDDPDPINLENRWHLANYVYSLRQNSRAPDKSTVIKAMKIETTLPNNVDDITWNKAPATTMRLVPNLTKEKRLFTPLAEVITVRVLYNQQEIAFLLEIDDRTDSRPGEPVSEGIQDETFKMYSDAFAIKFFKQNTITWYWNAGSIEPKIAPKTIILKEDKTLQKNNSLIARGKWQDGRWRVLIKGTIKADLSFGKEKLVPISFTNWDGSNDQIDSKHTLTGWYKLLFHFRD
jgi:mono/diheme cytochrome c family protein